MEVVDPLYHSGIFPPPNATNEDRNERGNAHHSHRLSMVDPQRPLSFDHHRYHLVKDRFLNDFSFLNQPD